MAEKIFAESTHHAIQNVIEAMPRGRMRTTVTQRWQALNETLNETLLSDTNHVKNKLLQNIARVLLLFKLCPD